MVICQFCGKEVHKKHARLCGKNPARVGIKKGGHHKLKRNNDKTERGEVHVPVTSPLLEKNAKEGAVGVSSVLPATQSKSNILKEINMKGEFDKMTTEINPPKKKNEEPNYVCGQCKGTFDVKTKYCPHCGVCFE